MREPKLSRRIVPGNLKTILTLVKYYPTRIRPAKLAAMLGVSKELMYTVAMDLELRKGEQRYAARESKLRFRSKEELIKVAQVLDHYGTILVWQSTGSLVFECRVSAGGPPVVMWLYTTIGLGVLRLESAPKRFSLSYRLSGVHPVQEVAKLILPYITLRRKMWKLLLEYRPRTYGRTKAEIKAEIDAVKAQRRPHGPNAPDLGSFSRADPKWEVDGRRYLKQQIRLRSRRNKRTRKDSS